MMAQFLEIKQKAGDALLFYRMGDFYELFFDDAVKAAAALDITLTKRGKHDGQDIPMCGVPHHSHENYLARLIRQGFDVAICEQTESPTEAKKRGAKSVVRREIVRIVTPGTLTEDNLLEASTNNYLGAVAILSHGKEAALAIVEISTGELFVQPTSLQGFAADCAALSLSELVVPEIDGENNGWRQQIEMIGDGLKLSFQPRSMFDSRRGQTRLQEAFNVASLDAFGTFNRAEVGALGALLSYIDLTQIGRFPSLRAPRKIEQGTTMIIDQSTRQSLELLQSQNGGRKGSLAAAIDRTSTGPGARLLSSRIAAPLTDIGVIIERQDATGYFLENARLTSDMRDGLKRAPDMARALSRLSLKRGGPRDLAAIRDGLIVARDLAAMLCATNVPLPNALESDVNSLEATASGGFSSLMIRLKESLSDTLPMLARDGGFVAKGFDPGLDKVRLLRDESRRVIACLEAEYRKLTGIKTLKIRNNNVLGYFVDVTQANADHLIKPPLNETFIHRQTLASAVRFSTGKLADLDAEISRARDEALARELEVFDALCETVLGRAADIASAADAIASIDVAASFAVLAIEENYCRPKIDDSLAFEIVGGRHPVVEQSVRTGQGGAFIANDCRIGTENEASLWLVTGPNMAGKSTFLRQNALMAIIAQTGGYVPATSAHIGVADRVFSRVGASDDIAKGRSTFMVEMVETAAILNQAGPKALVVLDEIGRGTSTFDGLSIAWAAVEHLHDKNKCRGLFATHYHEMTALSERLGGLSNVSMKVREWKGEVVFLHEVAQGPADRSYGVAVARLAGLPKAVVARASEILTMLETEGRKGVSLEELPLFAVATPCRPDPGGPDQADIDVTQALAAMDPDTLSPREALEALYRLKSLVNTV